MPLSHYPLPKCWPLILRLLPDANLLVSDRLFCPLLRPALKAVLLLLTSKLTPLMSADGNTWRTSLHPTSKH